MANPFCHTELSTQDPGKAREFYGKLFDWKFDEMKSPAGTITMIKPGEGPGGSLMAKRMAEAPTAWLPYVQVDSVDATLAKARKLGADVVVEKQPIPDMGAFAVFIDPTGAALGIWENATK